MTIDKAIELGKEACQSLSSNNFHDHADAVKMGLEALKWRLLMERDYGSWCGPLLPGETKE